MPKYYCEYCDINLTHSSPAGRRQHNSGRRHINNKIEYYQQLLRSPEFIPPAHIAVSRNVAFANSNPRFPAIMRPNMLVRPPSGTAFVGAPGQISNDPTMTMIPPPSGNGMPPVIPHFANNPGAINPPLTILPPLPPRPVMGFTNGPYSML